MTVPPRPKIYHILHEDRLPSVLSSGQIHCHAEVIVSGLAGTNIGMNGIKQRRLSLPLTSRPGLMVGDCVPFYFCPRSVMLYLIHKGNHPELTYTGGQGPIVHLEADLLNVVSWANGNNARWAFALSNAGSNYFEDRADLSKLGEIDWSAVTARQWAGSGVSASVKEGKQAEFLLETYFPWSLVERIGVSSQPIAQRVSNSMHNASHRPPVMILSDWYY